MSRECTFAGAAHCKLSTAGVFSKVVGDGAHIGRTETENLSLPHFSRTESKVETHLFPVFGGKYISCEKKGICCNIGKKIFRTLLLPINIFAGFFRSLCIEEDNTRV